MEDCPENILVAELPESSLVVFHYNSSVGKSPLPVAVGVPIEKAAKEEEKEEERRVSRQSFRGDLYAHLEFSVSDWSLDNDNICRIPECDAYGHDFKSKKDLGGTSRTGTTGSLNNRSRSETLPLFFTILPPRSLPIGPRSGLRLLQSLPGPKLGPDWQPDHKITRSQTHRSPKKKLQPLKTERDSTAYHR